MLENSAQNTDNQRETPKLVIEVFIYNPLDKSEMEGIIDELWEIEKSRFNPEQAFERSDFEDTLKNTLPGKSNKGKTNTVILVKNQGDGTIFGFASAMPATEAYYEGETEGESFFPERLNNSKINKTAYLDNIVFKKSGSGILGRVLSLMEEELIKKGYEYLEMDARSAHKFATNLIKRNFHRIMDLNPHDSEYGPQVFIGMRIGREEYQGAII